MNRSQRRAADARAKMHHNAQRIRDAVDARNEARDMAGMFRALLFACIRREGRIRIKAEDLQALHEDDRVDLQEQDNGDVIVSFTSGG